MRVLRSWKRLLAAVVAVPVVVVLAVVLLTRRYDPGEATGDDVDIRLESVWHADYDDLYDAAGRPVGKTLGEPYSFPFPNGNLERGFIFDGPPEGETVQWHWAVVHPAGSSQIIGVAPRGVLEQGYRSQPFAQVILPMFYDRVVPFDWQVLKSLGWPWEKRVPIEKVDVTLEYWRGAPGHAALTFEGPFGAGEENKSPGGKGTVVLRRYYHVDGGWGTMITFSSSVPGAEQMPVLVYTEDGMRHPVRGAWPLMAKNGQACRVGDVAPEDIVLVTVGERVRRRTFHNIRIIYPGRPDLEHAVWMSGVAEILDREPVESHDFYVPDMETAARLAGVVRCGGIRQLHWSMRNMLRDGRGAERLAALKQEGREALLEAARSWSDAGDSRIRRAGIYLGLHMDFPRYVERALDCLGEDDFYAPTDIDRSLRQNAGNLTAAHIERIKEILLTAEPWDDMTILLSCINQSGLPSAVRAMAQLARDQRSAFWCRPLQNPDVVVLLGPRESWPLYLEARYVAANALDSEIEDEARRREIAGCLAGILTDRQRIASLRGFQAVTDCLARLLEPGEASEPFIGYLERTRQYTGGDGSVGRITRYINRWHGVDIGGLGDDPDAPLALAGERNWRQVRDDVLAWRETGVDPGAALRNARASAGDLRIVGFNSEKPEESLVGLWPAPAAVEYTSRVFIVESPGRTIAFSLEPRGAIGGWSCSIVWELKTGQTLGTGSTFKRASLPVAKDVMPPYQLVIEAADSPESVLSGTKVFEEWWKEYAPGEAPGD